MEINAAAQKPVTHRLFKIAFALAVFTILYNIAEGLVSLYFGYNDDSLALFGFGVDSFIEVVSGLGIAHMVLRIQRSPESSRDVFERTALSITGYSFYALAVGLVGTSVYNLWTGRKPETTFWGVIISLVSIIVMWGLVYGKTKIGSQLKSDAILADAECTKVCIAMSVTLLTASAAYELTRIGFIDTLGTLGLAYLSFKEGRECFEKIKKNNHCSCCSTKMNS
jgi:divalent metal cation (Fe/Co/Zn/Cd) transporter